MGNNRKEIREKIVSILKAKTDAGDRIFETRVRPFWGEELPGIAVYTESESAEVFEEPRIYIRKLTVNVEVFAEANDALDDTLDLIASQVEDLIDTDPTLGNEVNDTRLTNTEINLVDDGKNIVGSAKISFSVTYFTATPSGQAVPLSGMGVNWDNKAVDNITMRLEI